MNLTTKDQRREAVAISLAAVIDAQLRLRHFIDTGDESQVIAAYHCARRAELELGELILNIQIP